MQTFSEVLKSGRFVVTSELNPPKGTDLRTLFRHAEALNGMVDAFNVTDSAGANMTMAPIAAARGLLDKGIEPIMQVTGRDRKPHRPRGRLARRRRAGSYQRPLHERRPTRGAATTPTPWASSTSGPRRCWMPSSR